MSEETYENKELLEEEVEDLPEDLSEFSDEQIAEKILSFGVQLESLAKDATKEEMRSILRVQISLLRGEEAYRGSRKAATIPPVTGKGVNRNSLVTRYSAPMLSRLMSLARANGETLPSLMLRAHLREADRLERRAMEEFRGEGRDRLIRHEKQRAKHRREKS